MRKFAENMPERELADRMRIIQLLYERNVFQMQKAVPYVAERLNISRFTVYNYLKELGVKDDRP